MIEDFDDNEMQNSIQRAKAEVFPSRERGNLAKK
jgi:hypothetical protein